MTLLYTEHLLSTDIISYASDPLLCDKLLNLDTALSADMEAGSIVDASTSALATADSTSGNVFVVLDYAKTGQNYLKVARPFGVALKQEALFAADSSATAAMLSILSAQGFILAGIDQVTIPTT